jgi:pSer/pThr/pTyr-binding forkhead associated (FHA) protein
MTTLIHAFTRTDSATGEWSINDAVVRLRLWGTHTTHGLPPPPLHELTIGAGSDCEMRIHDPSHMVSRAHACLVRDRDRWLLIDLGSKNGVRVDGALRKEVVLEPGLEIGIGGVVVIAESPRSIELHGYLSRLLGRGADRAAIVDHALRAVRLAATRRVALVLCGEGDLVPTARSTHSARGPNRPFILCDPRLQGGKATVRCAESHATGRVAFAAATGGSVCVRARRPPPDFESLLTALRSPNSRVQLIVCGEAEDQYARYNVMPVAIRPLDGRASELDDIIGEYACDAMDELGLPRSAFPAVDHAWVREHASSSLPEIEKATLRLIALRGSRNLSGAAMRLGMAPVSLSRWIGRRRMPMQIVE